MTDIKLTFLVDDEPVSTMISEKMLNKFHFSEEIIIFNAATKALAVLKNIPSSIPEPPDIIFLDIRMPGMDGHEFLSEFDKLDEPVKKHTKIVMLTSSLNPEDTEKSLHYDFVTGFITKPLSEAKLRSVLIS